ncbi:hypothetical protein OEZ86_011446 [Tetradesmus obliquus]|nr:hypothetical protein OEZ86_011446 [Tetradesmus obliquus]
MLTFSHIRSKTRSSSPLEELQRQSKMAGPLFLQNLLAYSTSVVAVAFIGHLDDPSLLSSAVLANSLFNVSGYSVVQGLSAGMETLCGQAYGGRSYKALGLWLQRALLITWLMCLPISLLWTHAEPLLLAVGQKPSIAAGAARYLWCILPTLFMGAVVECLKRYLLAQQVVLPGMVITMVTSCLCPLYNWLLIFKLQLGLTGAAYAFVLSQATSCLLLIGYTAWRDAAMAAAGDPQATWSRPSMAVFAGWGMYLSYGVPACLMICMEWWCYEVLILLAGVTSNAEVAVGVMGLCLQISASAYMASMAYSSSVNTRIGNELGAGNAATARLAFIIGVAAVILVQACMILGLFFGARQVLALLTNNEEVEGLARQVFPILLPTFIGDGVNAVAAATLRGAGRQGLGAAINAVGYWCFGVPLSALFGLKLGMGVRGFWLGLLCTTYSMSAVQLLIIGRFNWPREVERAAALLASHEDEAEDPLSGCFVAFHSSSSKLKLWQVAKSSPKTTAAGLLDVEGTLLHCTDGSGNVQTLSVSSAVDLLPPAACEDTAAAEHLSEASWCSAVQQLHASTADRDLSTTQQHWGLTKAVVDTRGGRLVQLDWYLKVHEPMQQHLPSEELAVKFLAKFPDVFRLEKRPPAIGSTPATFLGLQPHAAQALLAGKRCQQLLAAYKARLHSHLQQQQHEQQQQQQQQGCSAGGVIDIALASARMQAGGVMDPLLKQYSDKLFTSFKDFAAAALADEFVLVDTGGGRQGLMLRQPAAAEPAGSCSMSLEPGECY